MKELAGDAAEGFLCSQAGLPVQATARSFLDAFKKRFNVEPILYAPFTYDAANILIAAMEKANSSDPAKYLGEVAKITHAGASGAITFDSKGDRRDAEITIFEMKGGKIEPIALIKAGKTFTLAEFLAAAAGAAPGGAAGVVANTVKDAVKDAAKDIGKAIMDAAKK